MAKRFTDSGKWNKPFLRGMKAPYKLLWLYILDECDHAGIWQVDFVVAQVKIGEKLKENEAINFFSDKIFVFDRGQKWFIYDFIEFQYGELNPLNRAHNSVLKQLEKYGIDYENKPLTSPLEGRKDKDKELVKELELVKDKQAVEKFYRAFKHLSLTFEEFGKLLDEGWTQDQIDHILDQIENYRDNKKYTVLLTTARNWLKKDHKGKTGLSGVAAAAQNVLKSIQNE
jgi:hypothetical protein